MKKIFSLVILAIFLAFVAMFLTNGSSVIDSVKSGVDTVKSEIGAYKAERAAALREEQYQKCHETIHFYAAAAAAVGGGLAQLPLSDNLVLSGMHTTMVMAIANIFGKSITESAAKGLLGSVLAVGGGRALSQVLVGWIPGWGNAINASSAAAMTEALGWAAVAYFND